MNKLDCENYRRFGVEIELNTPTGKIRKLEKNESPDGSLYIARMIHKIIKEPVRIHGWHFTHNNNSWVVKPDSSCGIEVCSPVLKGWLGLNRLLKVIQQFKDVGVSADNRCSFHVHVSVGDLSDDQLRNVLIHWIKCEPVFFDMVDPLRKNNNYCQLIGISDAFDHIHCPDELYQYIEILGMKYFSINTFHYRKGYRKTIEFRIGGNDMCLDAFAAKNWIRLLLHFVEATCNLDSNDLCWLNPREVFSLLDLERPPSPGLKEVRDWALGRMSVYGVNNYGLDGVLSDKARRAAYAEVCEMLIENNLSPGILDGDASQYVL